MIGLMLQWFPGFSFADMLNDLESFGFFKYILPFLLIFAVIYAILTKIKIFEDNKGAAIIVALAVGLLALQLDYVPAFFQSIFPNLGIGLSILLAGLILVGAFIDWNTNAKWIFFGIGALVFIIVVASSLASNQFTGGWQWTGWWGNYGGLVVFLLMVAGVIIAVVLSNRGGGAHP